MCVYLQVKDDAATLSPEETHEQMEHVQEAYDVLSSSKLRQQYDDIGYSGEPRARIATSVSPTPSLSSQSVAYH